MTRNKFAQLVSAYRLARSSARFIIGALLVCVGSTAMATPPPVTAVDAITDANCSGSCDGGITVTPTSGVAPYVFNWTNSSGTPLGQATATVNGLCPGDYHVTVTDAMADVGTFTYTVNGPTSIVPVISMTNTIACYGDCTGGATVTVTGGTAPYTYLWSDGSFGTSIAQACAGAYDLTVTDFNGCDTVVTAVIVEPIQLNGNLSTFSATCTTCCDAASSFLPSGGTPPFAYCWWSASQPACISTNSYFLTVCPDTAYFGAVTDAAGCTDTVTFIVASALANTITGNTTVCPGACDATLTATATGGTQNYTYAWSTGSNQAVITGLCAGTYSSTITDANGTTAVNSQTITASSGLYYTMAHTEISCAGACDGSATIAGTGGTAPYQYLWATGATTASISGMCPGFYGVTITDANGCTIDTMANYFDPAPLNVSAVHTPATCGGCCDGYLDCNPSSGVSPYSYCWSQGAGCISTTNFVSNVCTGTYTLVVTDANGCTNSQSVTVGVAITTTVTAGADVCPGACTGTATVTAGGGAPPYAYAWSNGMNTASASALCAGTHTVTVTDANGGSTVDNVTIGTLPSPVDAGPDISVCAGNCVQLNATQEPGTYSWSPASTLTSTTIFNPLACPTATTTYIVSYSDGTCTWLDGVTVTVDDAPQIISMAQTPPSTLGGSDGEAYAVTTTTTVPQFFQWSDPAMQTDSIATGLTAGTYSVTITNANGCTVTDSVVVNSVSCNLVADIVTTDVTCAAGSDGTATAITTGGTAPFAYAWSNAETTSAITGLFSGIYGVTVTDVNGCTAFDDTLVGQPVPLAVDVIQATVGCEGTCNSQLALTVTGGVLPYLYQWSEGSNTAAINVCTDLMYECTVTDANGCQSSDSVITVNFHPAPVVDLGPDTLVFCNTMPILDPGAIALAYNWSTGEATQSIIPTMDGVAYQVWVADGNGCQGTDSIFILDSCNFVWPGDVDFNGVANNLDLLPIGQHYAATGPVRPNATILWSGQWADSWSGTQGNGANFKHIDTDGDGVVGNSDTLAIVSNYGLTHAKTHSSPQGGATDPMLFFDIAVDTAATGTPFAADLHLGTASLPADSVYGIAFTVLYDETLLDSGSVAMNFTNSWIGAYGTTMLAIQKDAWPMGRIEVAITRIDQMDQSGFGPIAKFGGITIDNLSGKNKSVAETLELEIVDVHMINVGGIDRPVTAEPGSVIIEQNDNSVSNPAMTVNLNVFPVPARDQLRIVAEPGQHLTSATLTDLSGRQVQRYAMNGESQAWIDVQEITQGWYILSVTVDGYQAHQRVAIVR